MLKKKSFFNNISFLTFVLLVISNVFYFVFVEQIFTNNTTGTNCYTSNINIKSRFLSFSRLPKMTRNDQVPFICLFPQNNKKSYQPLSDGSNNNNKSQFPPDTSSDFLAIVQTDGQMTDRQTDVLQNYTAKQWSQTNFAFYTSSPWRMSENPFNTHRSPMRRGTINEGGSTFL